MHYYLALTFYVIASPVCYLNYRLDKTSDTEERVRLARIALPFVCTALPFAIAAMIVAPW
jgi:hypothetical protein